MNPRERILAAIEHREPDRVPLDLGATPSSGISAIAYGKLKRHLGLPGGHTRVYDVVQQLAQPEDAILDRFGVDVLDIGRAFDTDDSDWCDVTLVDGQPAQYPVWFRPEALADGSFVARAPDGVEIARMPSSGTFFDQTCFPWVDGYPAGLRGLSDAMGKVLWSALVHSPWSRAGEPGFWDTLREQVTRPARHERPRADARHRLQPLRVGDVPAAHRQLPRGPRAEPEKVEALLDALMETAPRRRSTKACRAVGDVADIVRFGDDLGTNGGPFMSPAMYRRLLQAASRAAVRLRAAAHADEDVPPLVRVDPRAPARPDRGGLRRDQPGADELPRHGAGGAQGGLRRGTSASGAAAATRGACCRTASPAEVKDHVRRRLEVFAPGGGFVFNTVHNILPDVPPANVVAMYEAVAEFQG